MCHTLNRCCNGQTPLSESNVESLNEYYTTMQQTSYQTSRSIKCKTNKSSAAKTLINYLIGLYLIIVYPNLSYYIQGPEIIRVSKFFKESKDGKFVSFLSPEARTLYETFRKGAKESSEYSLLTILRLSLAT